MKPFLSALSLSVALIAPVASGAETVALSLADPQPSKASLAPGLAVNYAFPGDVKSVRDAKRALEKKSKPGKPLTGLGYDDSGEGDHTLTSEKATRVAAAISGYIKFDRAGTYTLDFLNNDGLEIAIGGQEVGSYDGIHSCGYAGEIDVDVPAAGFYALEATYFQRKGTACLMMEWGPDSDGLELVPDSAFFYQP
ncbi:MAG: PA14 domain-containing protein [Roseobacter sp.]